MVPVQDEQTGKVEVQLAEDIYEDQENTDSEIQLSSQMPFLLSVGFVELEQGK